MRVREGFPITLSVYSTAVSLSKSHNAFLLHGCCIIYLTLCLGEKKMQKKKKKRKRFNLFAWLWCVV